MGVVFLIERLPIIIPKGRMRWLIYIIFLFLLLVTIKFILSLIKKFLIKFSNKELQIQAEDDIHKLEEKVSKNKNKLVLPLTKQLKQWHSLSQRLAKEWSEDAREMRFSVSIENFGRVLPQIRFYSDWKNQELVIFIKRSISTSKMESKTKIELDFKKPFFIRFPNWSWAVEKAFQRISHIIGVNWILWLFSHHNIFHFRFVYTQGGVEKEICFDFDGKILKCGKDGKEIKYIQKKKK